MTTKEVIQRFDDLLCAKLGVSSYRRLKMTKEELVVEDDGKTTFVLETPMNKKSGVTSERYFRCTKDDMISLLTMKHSGVNALVSECVPEGERQFVIQINGNTQGSIDLKNEHVTILTNAIKTATGITDERYFKVYMNDTCIRVYCGFSVLTGVHASKLATTIFEASGMNKSWKLDRNIYIKKYMMCPLSGMYEKDAKGYIIPVSKNVLVPYEPWTLRYINLPYVDMLKSCMLSTPCAFLDVPDVIPDEPTDPNKKYRDNKTSKYTKIFHEFPGDTNSCKPVNAYRITKQSKIPSPTMLNYARFNTEISVLEFLYYFKVAGSDLKATSKYMAGFQYKLVRETDEEGNEYGPSELVLGVDDLNFRKVNALGYIESKRWVNIPPYTYNDAGGKVYSDQEGYIKTYNNVTDCMWDEPGSIRSKIGEYNNLMRDESQEVPVSTQEVPVDPTILRMNTAEVMKKFPIAPGEYAAYNKIIGNGRVKTLGEVVANMQAFLKSFDKNLGELKYKELVNLSMMLVRLSVILSKKGNEKLHNSILSCYYAVANRYDTVLNYIGEVFGQDKPFESLYYEMSYLIEERRDDEDILLGTRVLFDRHTRFTHMSIFALENYVDAFASRDTYAEDLDIMYKSMVFMVNTDMSHFYTVVNVRHSTSIMSYPLNTHVLTDNYKMFVNRVKTMEGIIYSGYTTDHRDYPAIYKDRNNEYHINERFKMAIEAKRDPKCDRNEGESTRDYVIRMMNSGMNDIFEFLFYAVDWDCMEDGSDAYLHYFVKFMACLYVDNDPVPLMLEFYGLPAVGKTTIFLALQCVFGVMGSCLHSSNHEEIFGSHGDKVVFNALIELARYVLWDDGTTKEYETTAVKRKASEYSEIRKSFMEARKHKCHKKGVDKFEIYRKISAIGLSNSKFTFCQDPTVRTGRGTMTRMVMHDPIREGEDVSKPYHKREIIDKIWNNDEKRQGAKGILERMQDYDGGDAKIDEIVSQFLYMLQQAAVGLKPIDRRRDVIVTKYMSSTIQDNSNDIVDFYNDFVLCGKINLMKFECLRLLKIVRGDNYVAIKSFYERVCKLDVLIPPAIATESAKYYVNNTYDKTEFETLMRNWSSIKNNRMLKIAGNVIESIVPGIFRMYLGSQYVFTTETHETPERRTKAKIDTRDGIHYAKYNTTQGYRIHVDNKYVNDNPRGERVVPYDKWLPELEYMVSQLTVEDIATGIIPYPESSSSSPQSSNAPPQSPSMQNTSPLTQQQAGMQQMFGVQPVRTDVQFTPTGARILNVKPRIPKTPVVQSASSSVDYNTMTKEQLIEMLQAQRNLN